MNRSLTSLGALLLGLGVVGLVVALADPDLGPATILLLLPTFLLAFGLMLTLYGVSRPDPEVTTVGGWFGSSEENLLRRERPEREGAVDRRYLPSPRESVHCVACYTIIPSAVLHCPRCARARRCESCGRPLFFLAGAVRCAPCVKDEVYCSCPHLAKRSVGLGRRRPAGG
jgi:LSD1 subclass zinc finger protein